MASKEQDCCIAIAICPLSKGFSDQKCIECMCNAGTEPQESSGVSRRSECRMKNEPVLLKLLSGHLGWKNFRATQ
jgi:hypothetical protein